MLRKHLIIVGSGWAGLKVARQLKNVPASQLRITLISDISNFRYSAALYRVATGRREREAIIPLSEVLEDLPNVDFVKAKISKIDRKKRTIRTEDGKEFHYDYSVLALGVITSYFGIPGLEEWSYSIKTAKELRQLRTHLHQELINEQAPDKNYVVIGAGPTGVELSAALTSYMKDVARKHGLRRRRITVDLIEAAPRVLPASHPRASQKAIARLRKLGVRVMLNKKVEGETDDKLIVNGEKIPTHTVIWTAGVTNNRFFSMNSSQFTFSDRGRIVVNDHLMVDDHVYVIGDNADTPHTGLGLTAVHNGHFVANDIKKRLKGKKNTSFYRPFAPATAVPIGTRWSIFQYKNFVISGIPAAVLRSLADLVAYNDILGVGHAFRVWLRSDQREELCTICQMALEKDSSQDVLQPHKS